jgi:hypothetical protein
VRASADEGWVVGAYQDPEITVLRAHMLQDRANDIRIKALERFDFLADTAYVSGFVRSLDVDIDEVVILKGFCGSFALSSVIGIEVAGDARNRYRLKTGEPA